MMFFQIVKRSSRAGKVCLLVAKCLSTCKTNEKINYKRIMNISNKTINTFNISKEISKEHRKTRSKPRSTSRNPSTKFSSNPHIAPLQAPNSPMLRPLQRCRSRRPPAGHRRCGTSCHCRPGRSSRASNLSLFEAHRPYMHTINMYIYIYTYIYVHYTCPVYI